MPRPTCAVFDIDGVLADVRHRLHHLDSRPKNWPGFFAAMSQDPPLSEGIALARDLATQGHDLVYLTGRTEAYRSQTQAWFEQHEVPSGRLVMRPDSDRRPARLFKPEALQRICAHSDVVVVIDDDPAVVFACRSAGLPVTHATWMHESAHQQQSLFDAQETEGRT